MDTHDNIQNNKITDGVIWKQLLIFVFPIIIGTIFQQLYTTVDAIVVGRFVGKAALASVGGSVFSITNLVIAVFTGLASGATVIISQYYGAKDEENIHSSLHTAFALSLTVGLIVSILGWLLAPTILKSMNTPAEIIMDSIDYLRIYFTGLIATVTYNMGAAIMRAIGDSKRPLHYLVICSAVNIVLDLIFVVIFHMGIQGAALATIIAQIISSILVTIALMRFYPELKLIPRDIRFDKEKLLAEIKIGLPTSLQYLIFDISNVVVQTAVNNLGTDTAAAWSAYVKLDSVFWAILGAFGIAAATFTGQNLGAQLKERVVKSVRVCMTLCLVICGGVQIFLMIFCRPLFYIFTTDLKVIDIGVYIIRELLPYYSFFVGIEILTGALRGIGDVAVPTLITLAGVGLVRLPFTLFLAPIYQHINIPIYSYAFSWGATILLLIPYYIFKSRKLLKEC